MFLLGYKYISVYFFFQDDDLPSFEEAMIQRALEESATDGNLPNHCFPGMDSCVDAITYLERTVMEKGEPFVIEVRRSHILKDAMKEARKSKFQPTKPLQVYKHV